MSTEKRPKVSVAMITYNHERYIEQAVRSVMMQQTDFEYELIIGEDCSTDRTREIVLRLKAEFGDRIRLLLHERNQGMVENFFAVYGECQGEYVALIEGDDCWINPRKLQMQVEYLDSHPECVISHHRAILYDEISKTARIFGWDVPTVNLREYVSLWVSLVNQPIPTASVMFRRPSESLPEEYRQLKSSLDWELYVWLLLNSGGQAHLLTGEPYSIYRLHPGGITHSLFENGRNRSRETLQKAYNFLKNFIDDIRLVSIIVPKDYKNQFDKRIYNIYLELARLSFLVDRASFYEVYETLKSYTPGKRYIPPSPLHLRLASLLFGYPRAEWLAEKYRTFRAKFDPNYRNSATILRETSSQHAPE
ncbi:MAG: glycosyltransferase family 2 protein [Candidatus Flexifilum sp.]